MHIKSKDNKASKEKDKFNGIVAENDSNDLKLVDSSTRTLVESNANKIKDTTTKKYEEIDIWNKIIMRNNAILLESNSMHDLSDLAIAAISTIDNIERGSLKEYKKVKSF